MLGTRYHIASLVAVFLALAVGVILGTLMVDRSRVEKQREAVFETLLNSIKNDIEEARKNNRTLQESITRHEEFLDIVFPSLVEGRLSERRIAVVMNSQVDTKTRELTSDSLDKAGGLATYVSLTKSFPPDDEASQALVAEFPELAMGDPIEEAVWRRLAAELNGTAHPLLDALTKRGYVELSNPENLPAERAVIFIAGESDLAAGFLAMAETFNDSQLRPVVLDTTEHEKSPMKQFQDIGMSSIDNADTSFGQLSIVLVLSGKEGNFGVGSTAQALIPELQ